MENYMKKILTTIAAILISTVAAAEPFVIYAGKANGGYDRAAQTIQQRLTQRNIEAVVENRNGSDDISLQVCRNEFSAGILQVDAAWARSTKDGCNLSIINNYGTEFAHLLVPPGSRINELSDIDSSHTIFVDTVGSGSELTWRTMVAIEQEHGRSDEWSEANVVTGDIRRAHALATRGDISAILLVRRPNADDIQRFISQGWTLAELWDRDLNDLKFGNESLYRAQEIQFTNSYNRVAKQWVLAIDSFYVANIDLELNEPEIFDALIGATE
jgi:TRAP-type uncharacterized transport system substrate-binding protein